MTRPTFAIVVTFDIDPSHRADFEARVLQQRNDSLRNEEACHQFEVLVDTETPNRFVLYETYDDPAAFEAHRQTSYFDDFFSTVSPWIQGREIIRLNLLSHDS